MEGTIWATIVGGAIASSSGLGAWWLSRRDKERDRRLSLKKEVFMELASALEKPIEVLSNITNLNLPREQVFAVGGSLGTTSRLAMIADERTATLAFDALAYYAEACTELIPFRWRTEQSDSAIRDLQQRFEFDRTTYSAALARGERLNDLEVRIQGQLAQRTHLIAERAGHLVALYSETLRHLTEYRSRLGRVLVSLRREIDFGADTEWLNTVLIELDTRQRRALSILISDIQDDPTGRSLRPPQERAPGAG